MSYIYTFIRKDISPEQKIVQIGHACFEAGKRFQEPYGISSLILLEAEDERDILQIVQKLNEKGIEHYVFFEPDNNMGYSSICTCPIEDPRQRKFFKKWKLFKHIT